MYWQSKTRMRRILLVDDEPDVAVTIEAVLEESGFFQVDQFHDAALALSIFRPGVYDLALLDIKMPRMDGFELCKKVRGIDNKIIGLFIMSLSLHWIFAWYSYVQEQQEHNNPYSLTVTLMRL